MEGPEKERRGWVAMEEESFPTALAVGACVVAGAFSAVAVVAGAYSAVAVVAVHSVVAAALAYSADSVALVAVPAVQIPVVDEAGDERAPFLFPLPTAEWWLVEEPPVASLRQFWVPSWHGS